MTETLTDDERYGLECGASEEWLRVAGNEEWLRVAGNKALAIIDDLTEALAAAERQIGCAVLATQQSEARCRELAAENKCEQEHTNSYMRLLHAAESRLAAATALLGRFVRDDSAPQGLVDEAVAFLANQPAAPTRFMRKVAETGDLDVTVLASCTAPTRAEACDECGTIHGPGNTNTLCSRASNYRGLGHSAWRNREARTEAERCPECGSHGYAAGCSACDARDGIVKGRTEACEHAGELTIDRATGEESCTDCQPLDD